MQLSVFKFQSDEEQMLNEIRTVEIDGEIWFVASDVAKTLGYKRPSEAVRQHCKEKGTVKDRVAAKRYQQLIRNFSCHKNMMSFNITKANSLTVQ